MTAYTTMSLLECCSPEEKKVLIVRANFNTESVFLLQ